MAVSRVQKATNNVEGSSQITCAFSGNVTAGNLLVVAVVRGASGSDPIVVGDISKSAGTATLGTFTLDVDREDAVSGGYQDVAIFSVPVTGTGSCTIQVAGGPAAAWWTIEVVEYSGADTGASRVAGTNEADGSSTSPSSGNVVSGGAGVFVGALGVWSGDITITPDASFTQLDEYEQGSIYEVSAYEERIVASDTTDAATWTLSSSEEWCACLAVYKAAASGVSGSLSSTLAALALAAASTVAVSGAAASTLGALASAAAGTVEVQGAAATELQALAATASAAVAVQGAAAAELEVLGISSSATVPVQGSASPTLDALLVSATGTTVSGVSGSLEQTLAALPVSGSAMAAVQGATTATLDSLAVAAGAAVDVAGTTAATLGAVTVAGAGEVGAAGVLSVTLGALEVDASGAAAIAGVASLEGAALTGAASAAVAVTGVLSSPLAPAGIASQAALLVEGVLVGALAEATVEPVPLWLPVARPGASRYATRIEGPTSAVLVGSRHTTAKV